MSTTEQTIYECAHGRVGGGICIDCRQPVAAVCPYCGAGRTREREATMPLFTCASCDQLYPLIAP